MPVGLSIVFVFCFFVFIFLRSLYVYFVLVMQVYIVNTQKWLILYTFAQKMVNIVQIINYLIRNKKTEDNIICRTGSK